MKFSPQLNVKTAYNFQESLLKIEDYVKFCKQNNFNFAFYADNFSMHGAAEFFQASKKNNIQPIIGLTLEIEEATLILLAKNQQGFQKLSYLSSNLMDSVEIRTATLQNLHQYLSSDLIAVGSSKKLEPFLGNQIPRDDQYWELIFLPKISYLDPNQFEAFGVVKAIKNNITYKEINHLQHEHYLSDEEIGEHVDVQKQNQLIWEIAKKCHLELFPSHPKHNIVQYKTPNNLPAFNFLQQLCQEALLDLFALQPNHDSLPKYQERLNYELQVIQKTGFENYFLVVWDYVKFAREQKIMVGPGRGSAAGSLVSYLLKITEIDPIKYDLLFERFLNPERVTMPDIDIDFQDDRRDEVIEYLFEKYGTYNVATIVTYQTIGAKSAIRDVARVYELDLEVVNLITKNIDFNYQNDLTGAIEHNKTLGDYAKQYPQIFEIANTLLGLPRQTGTHAAGIVLTATDLRSALPLKIGYNGIYQTQFDMNFLEQLGLIKMDLLGLRNLTTLQVIKKNILKNQKKVLDLQKVPLDDQVTFANLRRGNTSGIFQLESPGMTRVVEAMEVASIDDISIASALFRPGPQEMIPEYLARKKQQKFQSSFFIDPSLKDILEPTYGIMVYQEQVLQILQQVARFSLAKADVVRRAIGKKDWNAMQQAKAEFLNQALANGYAIDKAEAVWNWIEKFANYGFNKSHSIAYSYISYWLAYLKTHYPAEFYAALLSGVIGNAIKTGQYLKEVKQLGVVVKNPSVKNMTYNYTTVANSVFLPLTLIKGIGLEFVRKLREEYQKNSHLFDSIFSFVTKMYSKGLNSATYRALTWAGALDSFGYSRQTLINNEVNLFNFAKWNQNLEAMNPLLYPVLEPSEATKETISLNEKNYLGFYISAHPLSELREKHQNLKLLPINIAKQNLGANRIMGIVQNIRIKVDKTGQDMAFLDFLDDTDEISITIFGRLFDDLRNTFQTNSVLALKVKTEEYKGKISGTLLEIIQVIRF